MINPILKAVGDVKYKIPRQILDVVFAERRFSLNGGKPITIDDQIFAKVVRPRVLVDCDLVGGTEAMVSLDGLDFELTDRMQSVFHIPKEKTQGRSINSVLSISYITPTMANVLNQEGMFQPCSVTATGIAGRAAMNAMLPMVVPSSSRVQLISENTVLVYDNVTSLGIGYIRCILANDEQLSHLQIRSIPFFGRLVELAVKSFIYNEMIVTMDQGRVQGGFEIGAFRSQIEKYEDAETMYTEYLQGTWSRVAFMNDTMSHERYIRSHITFR